MRKQGVVGLAVGFLLGGAVSKTVSSLVTDIINPIIAAFFGNMSNLKDAAFEIHGAKILWGDFTSNVIDFLIVSAVVYFGIKGIGLENLDKKEEKK